MQLRGLESQTMAACGGFHHIFEKPLPESSTLFESLSSWNQKMKSLKPIDEHSFTESFGGIHFEENPESASSTSSTAPFLSYSDSVSSSSSSSSSSSPPPFEYQISQGREEISSPSSNTNEGSINSPLSDYFPRRQFLGSHRYSDSFSSINSESLQLCTEGLGFESSDDVEDLKGDIMWKNQEERARESLPGFNSPQGKACKEFRRSKSLGGAFPPPISSIGKNGKPEVCFRSFRCDGRFVLKEIRIPTQEFLHARREDGRLMLQFVQSDDEGDMEEGEDEGEEEDEGIDEEEEAEDEGYQNENKSDKNDEKKEESGDEENVEVNGDGGDC